MKYSKQDLLDLLKRHSGKKSDPCDCNCPYTGNAIDVLFQFIGVENNIPELFINEVRDLYKNVSKTACFMGKSRLVNAGAVFYIQMILTRSYSRRYSLHNKFLSYAKTQEEIGNMFHISMASLRIRYQEIVRTNHIEIPV